MKERYNNNNSSYISTSSKLRMGDIRSRGFDRWLHFHYSQIWTPKGVVSNEWYHGNHPISARCFWMIRSGMRMSGECTHLLAWRLWFWMLKKSLANRRQQGGLFIMSRSCLSVLKDGSLVLALIDQYLMLFHELIEFILESCYSILLL